MCLVVWEAWTWLHPAWANAPQGTFDISKQTDTQRGRQNEQSHPILARSQSGGLFKGEKENTIKTRKRKLNIRLFLKKRNKPLLNHLGAICSCKHTWQLLCLILMRSRRNLYFKPCVVVKSECLKWFGPVTTRNTSHETQTLNSHCHKSRNASKENSMAEATLQGVTRYHLLPFNTRQRPL